MYFIYNLSVGMLYHISSGMFINSMHDRARVFAIPTTQPQVLCTNSGIKVNCIYIFYK